VAPEQDKPGNCCKVLRLTVILDYLVCASAGEEVELKKGMVSLEVETVVRRMIMVL
jgi:hypothetical protein